MVLDGKWGAQQSKLNSCLNPICPAAHKTKNWLSKSGLSLLDIKNPRPSQRNSSSNVTSSCRDCSSLAFRWNTWHDFRITEPEFYCWFWSCFSEHTIPWLQRCSSENLYSSNRFCLLIFSSSPRFDGTCVVWPGERSRRGWEVVLLRAFLLWGERHSCDPEIIVAVSRMLE